MALAFFHGFEIGVVISTFCVVATIVSCYLKGIWKKEED